MPHQNTSPTDTRTDTSAPPLAVSRRSFPVSFTAFLPCGASWANPGPLAGTLRKVLARAVTAITAIHSERRASAEDGVQRSSENASRAFLAGPGSFLRACLGSRYEEHETNEKSEHYFDRLLGFFGPEGTLLAVACRWSA